MCSGVASNVLVDTTFGDQPATDAAFAQATYWRT